MWIGIGLWILIGDLYVIIVILVLKFYLIIFFWFLFNVRKFKEYNVVFVFVWLKYLKDIWINLYFDFLVFFGYFS